MNPRGLMASNETVSDQGIHTDSCNLLAIIAHWLAYFQARQVKGLGKTAQCIKEKGAMDVSNHILNIIDHKPNIWRHPLWLMWTEINA